MQLARTLVRGNTGQMRFSLANLCHMSVVAVLASGMARADDLSLAGPRTPSRRDVTVVRSDGSTFVATVHYPATSTAVNAPVDASSGPLPVLAFGHGFVTPVNLYLSTGAHLASWGIVVILPQSQGGLLPSHSGFALDLVASMDWLVAQSTVAGSPWQGAIDGERRAVAGHSMGGGCALLAAKNDPRIRAVIGLAAANTIPSSIQAAVDVHCATRLIVGSQDLIVPPSSTSAMYPNLAGAAQSITITGGFHCGFVDSAITFCDSGSISHEQQLAITRREMTEFLLLYLVGDRDRCGEVWSNPPAADGVVQQSRRTPDLDGNGRIDGADLTLLLSAFGSESCVDVNGDGRVDGADLTLLLAAWST
ncbi:MAG: alpha/beta hydrolase [Phycisphaerae bacterium]|nr:alpha/beta hydrolase [Phycisphaerae bacterium]